MKKPDIYGLMAEFDAPEEVLAAAQNPSKKGYRHMDAYTPFPMEELTEALSIRRSTLSLFVLCCAIAGGTLGFAMQYYSSVIDYPLNIGGKPLNSWPQFVPVTFELTILFAALSAVLGMIILNGLPEPYHPVFNVPRFEHASRDKFFLLVESADPKFDRAKTLDFLKTLDASEINEVEP